MELHKLLVQQLAKTTNAGIVDSEMFLDLVNSAYQDHDRDRRRADRGSRLMAEELEAASAEMQVQNLRFQAALDNMPLGLCLFHKNGKLIVTNRRFLELYGLDVNYDGTGKSLSQVLDESASLRGGTELERRMQILEHAALSKTAAGQIEQTWPDGRSVNIARNPVKDGGFLDIVSDITETRHAAAQIAHMANYDALTDLPNRRLFRERLAEAIRFSERGERSAILCLDLDRFKTVNDTLGHPVGDAVLIEVTKRLVENLRGTDTAARLGGDEFAIIVRRVKRVSETHALARRLIEHLSAPYLVSGHQVLIGASIGIEFIKNSDLSTDDLLRNADLALYRAKAEGRGRFCVFREELYASLDRRRQLELELRAAMHNEEFEVYYQPQIDIKSGGICGFEALVRWNSPTRGLVAPVEFIGLSEEIGLIDDLGAWVLRRACMDMAQMPDPLTVAVNLSPVQFKSRHLIETVRSALKDSGLAPRRLELEVTEGVMISDTRRAQSMLDALKKLGASIVLDDFGTGYSSLSYIRHFPFDKVKIDQSFVRDLDKANDGLAIIRAVVAMCAGMGIVSIAEGVETWEHFDILKAEQCDRVQGYLYSKPVPFLAACAFLEGRKQARRA